MDGFCTTMSTDENEPSQTLSQMKRTQKILLFTVSTLLLLSAVFALLVYLPSQITRRPFEVPKSETAFRSWEEVFAAPQPITLQTYSTGIMQTPLSKIMNLEHEKAVDIEEKMLELPVNACILHHQRFGHYLIDAGLDASYVTNQYGTVRGMVVKNTFSKGTQEPNTHIAAIVAQKNIPLKGVWLTHLHPDHIAGVVDLPKDIPYVVGKNDRYLNFRFFLKGDHLKGVKPLYEIDFKDGIELSPFGKCIDLLGDGSLWAIESSGHTAGHVMYLINGTAETVLVTGDACNDQFQFDTGIGPGAYSTDLEKGQEVLEEIIAFKERYPFVQLVYGHELVAAANPPSVSNAERLEN